MSNKGNRMYFGGIPILTIFTILAVLKLTGAVTWSWWWIICSLWVPFGLFLVAVVLITLISLVVLTIEDIMKGDKL